jgi:hypothetical protein
MCLPALDGPKAQMRHGSSGPVPRCVATDALDPCAVAQASR